MVSYVLQLLQKVILPYVVEMKQLSSPILGLVKSQISPCRSTITVIIVHTAGMMYPAIISFRYREVLGTQPLKFRNGENEKKHEIVIYYIRYFLLTQFTLMSPQFRFHLQSSRQKMPKRSIEWHNLCLFVYKMYYCLGTINIQD